MYINPNDPVRMATPILLTKIKMNQPIEKIAFVDKNGNPFDPSSASTGSQILLTGYAPHAVGNVAAGDTADVAIAKLEARITALEAK